MILLEAWSCFSFQKQEMELFKQEIELFLQLPDIWSENFFNKSIYNYFYHFLTSDNKKNATGEEYLHHRGCVDFFLLHCTHSHAQQCFLNRLHLKKVSTFCMMVQNSFQKEEMELFLPLQDIWSKNFSNTSIYIWSDVFKTVLTNRKWNYLNRKQNYF